MGYYDMDNYMEEPKYPEVDELLDGIRDKIKETLSKDVTDEVIYSSDIYKDCQETIKKLRSQLSQKENSISRLETEVKGLEFRMGRMKHANTYAEYKVGDECYFVEAASLYKLTCPFCKGNGKVKVHIAEGTIPAEFVGKTELICPECKNETYYRTNQPNRKIKEAEFIKYSPCKGKISRVLIDLKEGQENNDINYFVDGDRNRASTGDDIFHTWEEAKEYAIQRSIKAYNEVAFRTGNDPVKNYEEYKEMIIITDRA